MVSFTIEKVLPAPPEVVWPYLTTPDGMNAWAGKDAVIGTGRLGPSGRDDETGAVRTVELRQLGRTLFRLEEQVRDAQRPSQFVYAVLAGGAGMKDHEGRITLSPDGAGTRLSWNVKFGSRIPGWQHLLKVLLKRGLSQGLKALEKRVGQSARAAQA